MEYSWTLGVGPMEPDRMIMLGYALFSGIIVKLMIDQLKKKQNEAPFRLIYLPFLLMQWVLGSVSLLCLLNTDITDQLAQVSIYPSLDNASLYHLIAASSFSLALIGYLLIHYQIRVTQAQAEGLSLTNHFNATPLLPLLMTATVITLLLGLTELFGITEWVPANVALSVSIYTLKAALVPLALTSITALLVLVFIQFINISKGWTIWMLLAKLLICITLFLMYQFPELAFLLFIAATFASLLIDKGIALSNPHDAILLYASRHDSAFKSPFIQSNNTTEETQHSTHSSNTDAEEETPQPGSEAEKQEPYLSATASNSSDTPNTSDTPNASDTATPGTSNTTHSPDDSNAKQSTTTLPEIIAPHNLPISYHSIDSAESRYVLLLDPEKERESSLIELLHQFHWRTHNAHTIAEALKFIMVEKNDVLLIDLDTPQLDMKTLKKLVNQFIEHQPKKVQRDRYPIAAITSEALVEKQIKEMKAFGLTVILEKPLEPESVVVTIDELFLATQIS